MRLFATARIAAQLFFRVDEALVSSGNIVVYLNSKDLAFLRVANDLIGIVGLQAIRPDANVVGPILGRREILRKN